MDVQLGISGKDFVILLSDNEIVRSIMALKHDEDKIFEISKHLALSVTGESGDTTNFAEYIVGNAKLYAFSNYHELSVDSCAKFTRNELAQALRSRNPYNVNLLVGGYNPNSGKSALYRIDYLSSIAKVSFAAHGYGSYFCYSIFDKMYKEDLSQDEAIEILAACIGELNKRFIIKHSTFTIKIINKSGLSVLKNEDFLPLIQLSTSLSLGMSLQSEIIKVCQDLGFDPTVHLDSSKLVFINSKADPKTLKNEKFVMGIDEAGRGPVLGPMVYAASFCTEKNYEKFKNLGFVDSKAIDEQKREKLFLSLTSEDVKKYSGGLAHVLSPKEISESMLQITKYNLNFLAHDTTMNLIKQALDMGYQISHVYVDTVGPPESYNKKLSSRFPNIKFTVAKKADSLFPIVSAASIFAKVLRDVIIKNWVFPESLHLSTPISKNMGSGYPSDPVTVKWLSENIDYIFGYPDVVRFSWSTCSKLLESKAAKVDFSEDEPKEPNPYKRKFNVQPTLKTTLEESKKVEVFPNRSLLLQKYSISLFEEF
ncbi:hypothetical protein BB560_004036 [Smittium megazygosporum]|uniref:Ribonuclease n=1 Tax=Smittium megazygosporum TaxID=133381 RepID=A0A2T9ZAD0_9FUNG|nr:hypothetical protein BB560_004036 [Smittium megazygosporum]